MLFIYRKGKKGVIGALLLTFRSLPPYGGHKGILKMANRLKQNFTAEISLQNGILVDGVQVDPNSVLVKPYKGKVKTCYNW